MSTPSDGRPARKPNPRTMRLPGSVAEVQASPPGPEIAFFDLDGTLVAGFTGVLLTQDTFRRREIGARDRPDSRRTQETAPRRIPCAVPRPPSRTELGRRVDRQFGRTAGRHPAEDQGTRRTLRRVIKPTTNPADASEPRSRPG